MPNGFHGSTEEWDRLEAPLLPLDGRLERFAQENSLTLSKSARNWPDRSLQWSRNGIDRLIQIYLKDEEQMTFNFWICAYQDKDKRRYWKKTFLTENVPIADISNNLDALLREGYQTLESWQASELEFATEIKEFDASSFRRSQILSWAVMLLIYGGFGLGLFLLIKMLID